MRDFFLQLKDKFVGPSDQEMVEEEQQTSEYVELGTPQEKERDSKVVVRPYIMEDFEDIKGVLDALRSGKTIALVNIKPLKEKDLVELKRAINKLRKTCDAIDGDIAGFGDDYIVATPYFARIHRQKKVAAQVQVEQ
jgi:SepF-like predicted cell division protein (DUF552 family)